MVRLGWAVGRYDTELPHQEQGHVGEGVELLVEAARRMCRACVDAKQRGPLAIGLCLKGRGVPV